MLNAPLQAGRKGRVRDNLDLMLALPSLVKETKCAVHQFLLHCRCGPACCNVWPASERVSNELQAVCQLRIVPLEALVVPVL